MARDAAHATFVHALETMTAMIKADQAFPVPTDQKVIKARVRTCDEVAAFATAHSLGAPIRLSNAGCSYVDVPFGALIYRVTSERA